MGERILRGERSEPWRTVFASEASKKGSNCERCEPGERFMASDASSANVSGRAKQATKVMNCEQSESGEHFRESEVTQKATKF